MPAIYTRGGDTLNENILLKIFAFNDSASDARTPCIARGWDAVRRGPPVLIRPDHASWTVGANGIAISPDNTTLVVGRNLGLECFMPDQVCRHQVALYDARTGERRNQLTPRYDFKGCDVRCVSFSPDGHFIAVGTSGGLFLYSAPGGAPRRMITAGDIWFAQIGGANSMVLATGGFNHSEDCTLFQTPPGAAWYDYRNRWTLTARSSPNRPAATARFSPDSTMVAVARSGRRLRLMDTTTAAWRRIETRSSTVAFSPDGKTLASGHRNFVGLYDCGTLALRTQCLLNPSDQVSAVAFSAAGTLIFTVCPVTFEVRGNGPRLLNMSGPLFLDELVPARPTVRHRRRELDLFGLGRGIRKTEFSPDGSVLAVVGSNSNVALYDTATAARRLIPRP